MSLTAAERVVREGSTAKYTCTLQDENGTAIEPDDLDTLTLTLYNQADDTIINSRDGQDILNANGVTVAAGGALTWIMDPLDNVIVVATEPGWNEKHIALFEWTYNSGKAGSYEVTIEVESAEKIVT